MARKPSTKSSGSSSRKRQVHPKRTGIVWSVFLGAMTLAGGVLLLNDGWTSMPLTALSRAAEPAPRVAVPQGRWQAIVIHHSGSHTGSAQDIARQQSRDWGFPSMGYHFVIGNGNGEHDGAIIAGQRWYYQQSGAHVAERAAGAQPTAAWFNDNAIGICLIGNGESREFTQEQMDSLTGLVRDLQKKCGIPASNVFMHSDLVPVASPGRAFPHEMFALEISN